MSFVNNFSFLVLSVLALLSHVQSHITCCTDSSCSHACNTTGDACYVVGSSSEDLPSESDAITISTYGCTGSTFFGSELCEVLLTTDTNFGSDDNFTIALTTDLIEYQLSLVCDISPIITTSQKIKYEQKFVCCSGSNRCNDDSLLEYESSDAFDMYFKTKFECMHTEENSVNNNYRQVSSCDSVEIDYQSYEDVCEFYISKVYTMYSCQCLALARMSEMLDSDARVLLQSLFDTQLQNLLTDELKMYGCAINLQCDVDRDIADVLFEIERKAYFVEFDIFVSHDQITTSVTFSSYIIDGLTELLNVSNSMEEQIYIQDPTLEDRESIPGMRSNITVVFDSESDANDFVSALNGYNSTFPFKDDEYTQLIVNAQLSSDTIDHTEYYYGSHRVYPIDDRTEKDALIAGVVLTAFICVVCCLLIYWYRCRPGIEYK